MEHKQKLIRTRVIPDTLATDPLLGAWHKGWRKPGSETVAFYYKGAWYACPAMQEGAIGPLKSREEALSY